MIADVNPLSGYQEPYGLLCAILQDATKEWRWEMDPGLSAEAVIWQPFAGAQSIGTILLHIINAEVFWLEKFALDLPDEVEEMKLTMAAEIDPDACQWPVPPNQPLSWYFALHDKVRARTLESVKSWPNADFAKELHGEPRTMRWVLGHVIQHEAYHGGQCSLLQALWKQQCTNR